MTTPETLKEAERLADKCRRSHTYAPAWIASALEAAEQRGRENGLEEIAQRYQEKGERQKREFDEFCQENRKLPPERQSSGMSFHTIWLREAAEIRALKSDAASAPSVQEAADEWANRTYAILKIGFANGWSDDEMRKRLQNEYASAPKHPDGLQPIETAPKDGTEILMCRFCDGEYQEVDFGSWGFIENSDTDGHDIYYWLSNYGILEEPTHWIPLPAAPKKEEA